MGEKDCGCMWIVGRNVASYANTRSASRRRKLMEGVKLCHFVKVHSINFVD